MNALGPDVSFYQDDNDTPQKIDFNKMKANGAKFVIIRAGQRYWPDPDFADYWQAAKEAGLPRGSYWFYDSRESPIAQADLWLSILGDDLGELPMFLDVEYNYGGNYWGGTHWRSMLEDLKVHTNHELGIYTAYYVWRDNTTTAERDYFGQYPLWFAHYTTSPNILIPPGWSTWLFHQFTSNGDGLAFGAESLSIDLNYFNGDEAALYKRFNLGGSVPPTEPPTKGESMYTFVSNNHTMTLREAASDHVLGAKISAHAPTAVFTGDFLQFYPVDMEYARIGDFWMHVTAVDGAPVEGWVAVVHQGTKYGDITFEVTGNPTKVFPDEIVASIDGETKTYDVKS